MLSSPSQNPDLIAGFYEAAAHSAGWNGAWSALCAAFDADTGLLYRQSQPSAPPLILAARNWPRQAHGLPAGRVVPMAPCHAPRGAHGLDGQQSPAPRMDAPAAFDPLALPASAAFHVLRATVPLDGTALVGMGLHRPVESPRFTFADGQALDGVGRHVAAALRLETLLAAERAASALRGAALDLYAHGVIIARADGAVLFANTAARAIGAAGGITLGHAGIGLCKADEAARLEALIAGVATGGQGGCMRITRRTGPALLAAMVDPLPVAMPEQAGVKLTDAQPEGCGAMVLITLRDLAATADASPSQLMDLFGLTAAEAGIVPQLLAGDSASLIAQSRGVGMGTVKAQASRVLAKTGAANLRALSAMLAGLPGGTNT
jgi:DNA-binding CsgD family transcriptional regulator